MKDKIALVIGGTSGIGLGVAEKLTKKEIMTYSVGRRYVSERNQNEKNIQFIQADLSAPEDVGLLKKTLATVKLDYMVFSAATEIPLKIFSEVNIEEYNYAFSVNLNAYFFLTQMLLPNLNKGARLLFLTSRLSGLPEVGSIVYSMTKAALEVFCDALNKELSGKILSSSIIPGLVDTEMQQRLREADPNIFPHTHVYKELKRKLKPIESVSALIVSHLCDTDSDTFSKQRMTLISQNIE